MAEQTQPESLAETLAPTATNDEGLVDATGAQAGARAIASSESMAETHLSFEGPGDARGPSEEPGAGAPTIGRFSILRRVGSGAMGVVYAAYDDRLDRKVAIKLLLRAGAHEQARLHQEARGLAQLSHPNVVQVYEIGEHEGAAFLAMEFVEGETLSDWLEAEAKAPWRRRLALVIDAGQGLAAAHQKGLVHRDFKPDNVMIDGDGRARVMDFGLVRGQLGEGGLGELGGSGGSGSSSAEPDGPPTASLSTPSR